jgi:hypothetical protein
MSAGRSNHLEISMPTIGEEQRRKWMCAGCWGVCIGLALLEVWSGRQYSDPDGISYLDMSDALLRHNWHLLINPYWGQLYPFLIGVATWLTRPSAYWEFTVVHVVNFFIFLGALTSFEFLLRQVIGVRGQENERQEANSPLPMPIWIWQLIGYSLFAWSTFVMINGLRKVSPDLLVATFVYLDAGLLLRLRAGSRKPLTILLLGLTLGLGYLAKAIMFPIAFVFMTVAFLAAGGGRKAVLSLAVTFLVFVALAGPLFVGISRMTGRPSFGESGRMAYAWFIDGEEALPFYSTSPAPYLIHPLNRIHKDPNVFEFGRPFRTSYPLWFDPPYWDAGVKVRMNVRGQLRVISESLIGFYSALVAPMWGLVGGWLILFLMSPNLPQRFQNIVKMWPLLIPGTAAPCLYSMVLVQPRYIAPFVVLLWLGLFSGIRFQNSRESTKLGTVATLVISASMMVLTVQFVVYHLVAPLPILRGHGGMYYQVAESLNREGVQPGEAVAIIGSGWDGMFWARLARVRIVAQITLDDADGFWRAADPRVKAEVYEAFARTGAKAVVTEMAPPPEALTDWQRLGSTHYHVHLLGQP